MGLLDNLLGATSGGLLNDLLGKVRAAETASGINTSQLISIVVGLIENPATGGLAGLIQRFESAGLGQQVSSWIGTGTNLPVTADQVRTAIGDSQLQSIAGELGSTPDSVAAALAHVLPSVVDHLTPGGQVPHAAQLQTGLSLLRQFLHG